MLNLDGGCMMRHMLDDEPRNHLRLVDLVDDKDVGRSHVFLLTRQSICLRSLSNDILKPLLPFSLIIKKMNF